MGHNRMIKQETLVNWFKKAEEDISAIDETVLKDPERVFNPIPKAGQFPKKIWLTLSKVPKSPLRTMVKKFSTYLQPIFEHLHLKLTN